MRKLYTTKLINRPEMKFYLVLDYTLPSTWPKFTQVEIQNDRGSLGLVISLKTRKFHFSPTFTSNLLFLTRNTNDISWIPRTQQTDDQKCGAG